MVTSTSNMTTRLSLAEWKGQIVWLAHCDFPPCEQHEIEVMHHLDDEGRHYCPTGFIWCPLCCGIADEPEPAECTLSGEWP